jgi:hypothetical protein
MHEIESVRRVLCWWRPRVKETPYESNFSADRAHWSLVACDSGLALLLLIPFAVFLVAFAAITYSDIVDSREWTIADYSAPRLDVGTNRTMHGVYVMDAEKSTACIIRTVWHDSAESFQAKYPRDSKMAGWVYRLAPDQSRSKRMPCYISAWDPMPSEAGVWPLLSVVKVCLVLLIACAAYFGTGAIHGLIRANERLFLA